MERDTVGEREREGDAVSEDCGKTTVNNERNIRSQKEGVAAICGNKPKKCFQ